MVEWPSLGTTRVVNFPRVHGVDTRQAEFYCLALSVEKLSGERVPNSLIVTDFTRNSQLCQTRHPIKYQLDGCFIDDDQTVNVGIFHEKMLVVEKQYAEKTGQVLGYEDMASHAIKKRNLYEKLAVLKLTVSFKEYRGILQCRCWAANLVDAHDDLEELAELYKRIVDNLPREFFDKLGNVPGKLIPVRYLDRIKSISQFTQVQSTQDYRTAAVLHDLIPASSQSLAIESSPLSQKQAAVYSQSSSEYTSGSGSESAHLATQAAQVVVKNEVSDSIIADLEHQDDYESDEESSQQLLFGQAEPAAPLYTLAQLNGLGPALDNKIYRTNVYIVGSIPSDWTHVCAKLYVLEKSGQCAALDPQLLKLELLVTDSPPNTFSVLSLKNSLTVTFTGQDLADLFEDIPVELVYVSLQEASSQMDKLLAKNELQPLELFKKEISAGPTEKATVWSARNFRIPGLVSYIKTH